jgi:hypothetical protein
MTQPSPEWRRLVEAARQVPASPAEAPYGFATRVAARAFESRGPEAHAQFVRISLRALGVAVVIMTATVAVNLKPVLSTLDDEVAALSEPLDDEEATL